MRIIAGAKRGKKIMPKIDDTTRPTTDRVRENVFNILTNLVDIQGASVLDLFAGCGAYGLEAHSRGARQIVFNDFDAQAVEVIKKNAKACDCNAQVLNLDYTDAIEKLDSQTFDIIFIDPPYNSDFALKAVEYIRQKNLLSVGGVIVVETENDLDIESIREKKYGRARLYFLGQHSQLPK